MKGGGGGAPQNQAPRMRIKRGGGLNPLGSPGGHGVFLGSSFRDPTWGPPPPPQVGFGGFWVVLGVPVTPPPPPRPCGVPQPHFSPPFHPIKHQGTPKRHLGLGAFWGPLKAFWGLRSLLGGGGGSEPMGTPKVDLGNTEPKGEIGKTKFGAPKPKLRPQKARL